MPQEQTVETILGPQKSQSLSPAVKKLTFEDLQSLDNAFKDFHPVADDSCCCCCTAVSEIA